MPDLTRLNARTKQPAEDALAHIERSIEQLQPAYEDAKARLGEAELPAKVQELIDAVLAYDPRIGPHGAIWHLAKAHTIAQELVSPQKVLEDWDKIQKRRADLLAAMRAADAGDARNAHAMLEKLVDVSGRPLQ